MEKKREFIVNTLYIALIIIILYAFFKFLFPALIPFFIGFIVACAIRAIAKKIGGNSDKIKKRIAIILTFAIYGILFALIILLGIKMIDKIGNFIQSIPDLYNQTLLPAWIQFSKKTEEIALLFDESVALEVERILNDFQTSMGKYISNFSLSVVSIISNGIIGIPSLCIKLIVTVVSTFFIAIDFDKIIGLIRKIIGEKKYEFIYQGTIHTKNVISAYLKSYTLLFCLTYIELCIGFCILNIPYPTIIALAIAVFDILPILGTGGILVPWSLICLFIGNTSLGISIFVLYVIITGIRNTVEPKIVGEQIGLHPLATLIAMFSGLNLFGLAGLIFCPVLLVIVVSMTKAGSIRIEEEKDNKEDINQEITEEIKDTTKIVPQKESLQ